MKNLICLIALTLGLASQVQAATSVLVNAESVKVITPYLLTCASTTLSDTVPLELTGNTTIPGGAGIYELMIAPLSASATSYFSHSASVSSSGGSIGYPVYSLYTSVHQMLPMVFPINPTQLFYGIASVNGTPVMICRRR